MDEFSAAESMLDTIAVDADAGSAMMDTMAGAGRPFFFFVDAWARRWVVLERDDAVRRGISWDLDGTGPLGGPMTPPRHFRFSARTVSREVYWAAFGLIRRGQEAGETWLANLTFPSALDTDLAPATIAGCARAPFRLYVPGGPVVFSPERFVRISPSGRIESHPMKGTIDAERSDASRTILADEKETAEHVTIVDLIRNDIGMIASRVDVPRFRYITEVEARGRRLLQVSSEVTGEIGADWRTRTGSVFRTLLPAGSVTGAPKKRTGEIIREAEGYHRGWYTGVFGAFDGTGLDSAVAIRYIEPTTAGTLMYKSGGGITIYSDMEAEYAELKAKVYAPFG